jgi:lathosterol oxidase
MNGPIHLGPLNRLVADNRYHFIHHSRDPRHFNSNFAAIFPVIDVMFGTWRKPGRGLPETGLDGQLAPSTLAGYLLARLPDAPSPSNRGTAERARACCHSREE